MTRPTRLLEVLKDEFEQIHGISTANVANVSDLNRLCHGIDPPRAALCLSGGGIRSAAFALGIIQWLAAHGLLNQFQYMSTVSGGGYAGGWLSAWIRNQPKGYAKVGRSLNAHSADEAECYEIGKLRENSQYLTPRSGVMSGDTWTALAIWIRNLVLNWMVIVPAIAAFCILPQIAAAMFSLAAGAPGRAWQTWVSAGALGAYLLMFAYVTASRPFWNLLDLERTAFKWLCLLPGLVAAFLASMHVAAGGATCPWKHVVAALTLVHVLVWLAVAAIDTIRGRLRPRVYVAAAYRPQTRSGTIMRFEVHLSRPLDKDTTVKVSTDDRQAVDTIHYVGLSRHEVVFLTGDTRRTVDVTLKADDIDGVPIGGDDIRLRIDDAPGATIGRRRRPTVLALDLGGTVAAALAVASVFLFSVSLAQAALGALHTGMVPHQPADGTHARTLMVYACLSVPAGIVSILAGEFAFVAVTSLQPRSDEDREWLARASGAFLRSGLTWLIVTSVVLLAPVVWSIARPEWSPNSLRALLGSVGTLSGLLTAILGASGKTPALPAEQAAWRSALLYGASGVFLVLLATSLAHAVDELALGSALSDCLGASPVADARTLRTLALHAFPALAAASLVIGSFVNVNRFSLHAMYRNRLIRTFLGASNPETFRRNRFTWFNDSDNIEMHRLWNRGQPPPTGAQWRPFHVVNVALNVVATRRLAWQERKAEPFVFTPLWCGAANLDAFRRASEYGGRYKAVTLGTAMAISGAAISPNMGYNSSPVVTLLLTLFNVRLGWWFGNPRNGRTYRFEGPRLALRPLLSEAVGGTTDNQPYVYLSDGGHFENLGLYEMVRRRCRLIIVSDAGHDPECGFEDLSNAVRKISIDFGIPVRFPALRGLRKRNWEWRTPDDGGPGFTIGLIDYAAVDGSDAKPGLVLYLKPTIRGDEPADVLGYAASNPLFPHDGTTNQWFREAQFESYRSLAAATMERALTSTKKESFETLQDFLGAVSEAVLTPKPACPGAGG